MVKSQHVLMDNHYNREKYLYFGDVQSDLFPA